MQRLGSLVVARRVQLGYRRRPPFADAAGISLRTLGDIETGRRERYDPATVATLEQALQWKTGSVQHIIDGGDPTEQNPATETDATTTTYVPERTPQGSEAIRRVLTSDIPDDRKQEIIELLLAEKRRVEQQSVETAELMIRLARGEG
jgi:transcriptional regulator with XRE-family HTH domain